MKYPQPRASGVTTILLFDKITWKASKLSSDYDKAIECVGVWWTRKEANNTGWKKKDSPNHCKSLFQVHPTAYLETMLRQQCGPHLHTPTLRLSPGRPVSPLGSSWCSIWSDLCRCTCPLPFAGLQNSLCSPSLWAHTNERLHNWIPGKLNLHGQKCDEVLSLTYTSAPLFAALNVLTLQSPFLQALVNLTHHLLITHACSSVRI